MSYPHTRPRRIRSNPALKNLCAHVHFTADQLIAPIFITEQHDLAVEVTNMPNVKRIHLQKLIEHIENLYQLGIRIVALFPVVSDEHKTHDGSYAHHPDGIIPKAMRLIQKHFPHVSVLLDIALDPYTTHGQDGILDEDGRVLNDKTIQALVKQALLYASCGNPILAPSDMMDGRIGAIRTALENAQHHHTVLISYASKYASHFYKPFREAVKSDTQFTGDKTSYQMDYRRSRECELEARLDLEEGADMLIVKPALHYLDVIQRLNTCYPYAPILAYHVSGEYSMLKQFCNQYPSHEWALVHETITGFFRAGASGVITYYAAFIAEHLNQQR